MLSRKHRRTYDAIFARPVRAGIVWDDVEALFLNLGGSVTPAGGSRVTVVLNGQVQVFHRPHPRKETDKGAVRAVATFLDMAGVDPDAPDELTGEELPTEGEEETP